MHFMRAIVSSFQILVIVIVTIFCATIAVILRVITLKESNALLVGRKLWSPILLFITGVRVEIEGLENITKNKACIFVANHSSHFDIPVLFNSLPVNIYFVAKKELKNIPFLGWAIQAAGMIFIDRSDKEKAYKSLEKAVTDIKSGKNIFTFPEGTRSKTGALNSFKKGAFVIAKTGEIDIIPIALVGINKILPSNSYIIRPGKVKIIVGEKWKFEDYQHLSVEQMANQMKSKVESLMPQNSNT